MEKKNPVRGNRGGGRNRLCENRDDAGHPGSLPRFRQRRRDAHGHLLERIPSGVGGILVGAVLRLVACPRILRDALVLRRGRLRPGNPGLLVHGRGSQRLSGVPVEPRDFCRTPVGRRKLFALALGGTVIALSGCAQVFPWQPEPVPPAARAVRSPAARLMPLKLGTRVFAPSSPVAVIRPAPMPCIEESGKPARRAPASPLPARAGRKTIPWVAPARPASENLWRCRHAKPSCPGSRKNGKAVWWICRKGGQTPGAAALTGIRTAHFAKRPISAPQIILKKR